MADLVFKAFDLRTGAYLADLELASWEATDELSDAGSWSGMLLLPDGADEVAAIREATVPGRSVIVALRGGLPIYTGIVWRRRYDSAERRVDLAGAGLLSHWDRMLIGDITWTQVDQLQIFRGLVAHAVARHPGTDIGLIVHGETSGVLRDQTWAAWEAKNAGEALRQRSERADLGGGFDFDFRSEIVAGQLERHLRLWYPRRGRAQSASGLQFRTGSNTVLFATDDDGTRLAATVTAVGAGDGPDTLIVTEADLSLVAAGWPGYGARIAHKTVSNPDTLRAHARAELVKRTDLMGGSVEVQISPEFTDLPWGSWDLGDEVMLVIEDDPWFPARQGEAGLTLLRRIGAHQWRWDDGGETLMARLDPPA